MNLVKTSLYSGISNVIRVITAFVINKLIALYIGPTGLALMGNFQNLFNIISGLSSFSINTGIVKYTSEYSGDNIRLKALFSTSFKIIAFSSGLVGLGSIILSTFLSRQLMHTSSYAYLFILLGFSVFLYSLNTMILSILNGMKEIRKFTLVNIFSSTLSLVITSVLIYFKRLNGAIASVVVAQAFFFFVSFYFIRKCNWFSASMFFSKANRLVVRNLFRFSAMGITSALMVPLSLLLIRNIIIKVVSPEAAGYWEAMTRISSNYLMMVTTTLAIYYLPRLSETLDFKEVRNEIFKGYKLIMPLVILIATTIYLFRFVIIKILFSHQFGPMEPLFLFQLLGDIIKIASWLLAFVMLAKAMARMFIITEIIFNLTYVLLSYLFIHRYGLVGATYAYATNYLLYLITCYLLIRRKFAW